MNTIPSQLNKKEKKIMNKVTDINARTLEKEKKSFVTFCKTAEVIMTALMILLIIVSGIIVITLITANTLNGISSNIEFTGDYTTVEGAFGNIYILIISIGMTVAFNFGRNIFRQLKDGETPFRYEIADKIKAAAMAVFVTGTVDLIAEIAMTIIESVKFAGDVSIKITFDMFIWSAILFAVAYIFSYGCKLQQESDETL